MATTEVYRTPWDSELSIVAGTSHTLGPSPTATSPAPAATWSEPIGHAFGLVAALREAGQQCPWCELNPLRLSICAGAAPPRGWAEILGASNSGAFRVRRPEGPPPRGRMSPPSYPPTLKDPPATSRLFDSPGAPGTDTVHGGHGHRAGGREEQHPVGPPHPPRMTQSEFVNCGHSGPLTPAASPKSPLPTKPTPSTPAAIPQKSNTSRNPTRIRPRPRG